MYPNIKFSICAMLLVYLIPVSSCVKTGSSETSLSIANAINAIAYKYTWTDTTYAGTDSQKITLQTATLNSSIVVAHDTIYCSPSLPQTFALDQLAYVSLKKLSAYATISDQAVIKPVGNAPVLGNPGDYSVPQSYMVTSASGSSKIYVIVTDTLPELKVNKYQGMYIETGYFTHPTSPRALNTTKLLSYVDPNTVSCDMADLGTSGYSMTIKVNADNTCEVAQFLSGNPLASSQMVAGATNQYYPATHTFILNYEYLGASGWRIIADTLTKQ